MKSNSVARLFVPGLFFALFCLTSSWTLKSEARSNAPKIEFKSTLKTSLANVLYKTDDLRSALVDRKDALVVTCLRNLSLALSEALRTPDPDAQNKKHLDLILADAKAAVDRVPRLQGDERKQALQQAFKQLFLMGQTYAIDSKVKFYFCKKDRSVWFQREGRPKNPINPESMADCAQQVQ
jgi:hypothetical protein